MSAPGISGMWQPPHCRDISGSKHLRNAFRRSDILIISHWLVRLSLSKARQSCQHISTSRCFGECDKHLSVGSRSLDISTVKSLWAWLRVCVVSWTRFLIIALSPMAIGRFKGLVVWIRCWNKFSMTFESWSRSLYFHQAHFDKLNVTSVSTWTDGSGHCYFYVTLPRSVGTD